jgi:LuxR family maltose regulon positive regulatory protein
MPPVQAAELIGRQPPVWLDVGAQPFELVELWDEAPAFAPEFVRRPRLVDRLQDARGAALAVIVAPPGYGKSSLLSEWAEDDQRPFVWLRPGPLDADRCDPLLDPVRWVRAQACSCVVVLDDAHLLARTRLRELVHGMLRELPGRSMVALACRAAPALPLGRLRAHRTLVEIGIDDLAMSSAEAALLLQGAGFEFEPELVEALARWTEGWPVALYLAALSLRGCPTAQVEGFCEDDHLLSQYLHDEVLSALPPELMTFLRRTAIVEQLSGSVCDAVLAERGSAVRLANLVRANQLLTPLDPAHDSFRWHSLFRGSLLGELRRTEPELEPLLHQRASAWYADHGDTDRALDHASAARDAERTGDLLFDHLPSYLTHGKAELVRSWLNPFRGDQIAAYAPLALCAAHSCLATGDLDGAHYWAVRVGAAPVQDRHGGRTASMAAGLAVIEAMTSRGGVAAIRDAAQRGYAFERADGSWRAMCCFLLGTAEHLGGDRAAGGRLLELAIDLGGGVLPSMTALSLAQRAMIAVEQKDWELAGELTDRAIGLVEASGLSDDPTAALVFAAAASSRAHEGRADEAKRDLRSGVDLLVGLGDFVPWYGAEARILLAHASLWLADVVGARTLLAQASRLARRMPDAVIFEQWFDDAWSYVDTLAETTLAGPSSLTIAELRILRFLPSHRSFREIAAQLGVSANTVKTQAHAVYRKLGAASRSEAVARAMDAGLLGQ